MSSGSSATDLSTSGKHPGDFLGNYYEHLAAEDAASYSGDTLETRAMAHRELALRRPSGQAVIGIRNERNSSIIMIATDDMPFLVDSVTAEIVRQDLAIRMLMHPTFIAIRDRTSHELVELKRVPAHLGASSGDTAALPNLAEFIATGDKASHIESWISVETVRISDDEKARQVIEGIRKVLGDVRVAVEDWSSMRSRVRQIAASLDSVAGAEEIPDLDEAKELLEWLDNGNFTFLGYREYDLANQAGEDVLLLREGTGLGIMRELPEDRHVQHLTEEGRARAREKRALVITKANSRSTVHRAAYLDYIGVKSFDAQGNVNGERRFIGLFASSAYNRSVRSVPIVREKVDAVLKRSGFAPDSHSGKDLLSILESYPRDEIFQMGTQELADIAMGILRLQERRRTRLFLRQDVYGRFVSALVYLPRDRYTTAVRLRMQDELRKTFETKAIDYEARMTESSLARLFFRIRLRHGSEVPQIDVADLERRLAAAARSWSEGIDQIVRTKFDGEEAEKLSAKWAEAFPASYRVDYEVEDALEDIARFESYGEKADVSPIMHVYIPADVQTKVEDARLKLYLPEPQSLSQILPVFQNLGLEVLDERPFEIITADGEDFFLYDLGLKYPSEVDPLATGGLVQEAFGAVVTGRSESDRFDRLVVQERVPWREVSMLRSYARYVRQLGYAGSYSFTADTLLANPAVAHALISLFKVRFDPDKDEASRAAALEQARASLADGLQAVPTLDADRVLRTLANVIEATLRTNYFQNKPYLSIKLRPEAIEGAPFPRPKFEIWVYSPQVEGVHLRFGEVARGGLRWSDRREDFRTEILGLVKAQTVKNAVIVPTGAKGGFYAKQLPDPANDRAAWMAEGQSSYRTFIRGLLDITDNLVRTPAGQQVVPPERVVRLDGDDTYLVVAADKGTASFSDIANEISAEYGHWLGDAFASGGSVGYDHKAMGITARGAWESVKRHFSELGIDTQQEDFTVAGVGDMSGDVFGNGMLLSKHIRLVAAFDHRHIFLDPNPEPASSYTERKRLFELPRSSWADYDTSLISAGGGVYSRSIKSIELSPEVRQALGLNESVTAISPPELLRAILQSPVDLLYNGGIGTYVKASTESNAEVGDKANDNIRVNGKDLRAKVVGEGGNLGMTQRGRIEAALNGVILNTDAIDNSAGVDCSDHEVNIKVFVDQLVAAGKLPAAERTQLLQSMTDEVGRLVLEDNIDQNVLLLNDRQRVVEWSPSYERLMDWLEKTADLNRELEALPTTSELHERIDKGMGLTSPELSVLAAYAKIELTRALTLSNLADDPYFDKVLRGYFPIPLVERFGSDLALHPLRREIIATVVANDMINMGGITFAFRVMEETSVDEAAVAKAFVTLREIYELDEQVAQLNQLPASFPTEVWSTIHLDIRRLLDRAVRWYVNHTDSATPVGEGIAAFKPLIDPLRTKLVKYLRGNDLERVQEWRQQGEQWGLPETIAHQWAEQFESFGLLDIARIAVRVEEPVDTVAQIYYTVYDRFDVDALLNRITKLPREDRWQALARAAMRDDLYSTITDMTLAVMNSTEADLDADDRMQKWVNANSESIERAKKMFEEINQLEHDDMASLSVALRLMRSTVRS